MYVLNIYKALESELIYYPADMYRWKINCKPFSLYSHAIIQHTILTTYIYIVAVCICSTKYDNVVFSIQK